MKGHNYDHGRGEICKKCGKIHANPMKRPDVVRKIKNWWDTPAGIIRRKLLSAQWTIDNPMLNPEIVKKVTQNPTRNLKVGEASKRRWGLPRFKDNMSKLHSLLTTELWRDPVYYRNHIEGIRRFNSKPESTIIHRRAGQKGSLTNTPEKRRETSKKNWTDPEKRKNILDGLATVDHKESKRKSWKKRHIDDPTNEWAKQIWDNYTPEEREARVYNVAIGLSIRPNRPEKRIIKICEQYNFPFKYTGDRPYPGLGGKMPDFVYKKGKKILEHCGDQWHNEVETNDRIKYFEQLDYSTLILWEHDMLTSTDEEISNRINEFLGQLAEE